MKQLLIIKKTLKSIKKQVDYQTFFIFHKKQFLKVITNKLDKKSLIST